MKPPKRRWRKFMWTLGVIFSLYAAVCISLGLMYVGRQRQDSANRSEAPFLSDVLNLPSEVLPIEWIPADGQSTLAAGPKGYVLLAHGYGGTPFSWKEIAPQLAAKGYCVVAPWMAAHGKNQLRQVGFGRTESRELLEVAAEMRNRSPGCHITAVGVSLGGAATWLASAADPGAFDAILTEGAFADFKVTSAHWFNLIMPGGSTILAPVQWVCRWKTGIDPATIRPMDAAKKWAGHPAIVVHCAEDRLMPRANAVALSDAAGARLEIIDGAEHAHGSSDAPDEYVRWIVSLSMR